MYDFNRALDVTPVGLDTRILADNAGWRVEVMWDHDWIEAFRPNITNVLLQIRACNRWVSRYMVGTDDGIRAIPVLDCYMSRPN